MQYNQIPHYPGGWNYHKVDLLPQKWELHFSGGAVGKSPPASARGHRFDPWSGKTPHAAGQLSLCTLEAASYNQ